MTGDAPRQDESPSAGDSAGRQQPHNLSSDADAEDAGATDAATPAAVGGAPRAADATVAEPQEPQGNPVQPDVPRKTCNLCQLEFPRTHFKQLAGHRTASYCGPCTSIVCRGRSQKLSIDMLRRAMQDGTLERLLQKGSPVPPDRKRCKLCGVVKELENFRPLPRGGYESYCRPCNRYVRLGIKRGLHIDAVRQAYLDGTVDTLLNAGPYKQPEPCPPGYKRCNLCDREQKLEKFASTSKGISSYCEDCDKLVRRGRNKGMAIDHLRNALKEGNLDELLPTPRASSRNERRAQEVPEGYKLCNLCEQVRPESSFKVKYDGNYGSYCSAGSCDKLVGRGRRRGLSMEVMRAALKNGTLQHLLETHPIVPIAPGAVGGAAEEAGPTTSSGLVSGSFSGMKGSGGSSSSRRKRCNLCGNEMAIDQFRIVSAGRVGAYCVKCDRLIGRGRRRGLGIDDIRAAQANHTLESVLGFTAGEKAEGAGGKAEGPKTPHGKSHGQQSARTPGISDSGDVAEPCEPVVLGPETCVKCGNVFVPYISGETLCANCSGIQPPLSTCAAGPSHAAAAPQPASKRARQNTKSGGTQAQAVAAPLAGPSAGGAAQLALQGAEDQVQKPPKRQRATAAAAAGEQQQGPHAQSSTTSELESSATVSQDDTAAT